MQEKSILNVLLHVRAEIIRDGLDGLEHVDALLRARGFDPASQAVPRKIARTFGRGKQHQILLEALRAGPDTARGLAEKVAARHGGVEGENILASVHVTLTVMKRRGLAANAGAVWRLAR